jgi:hypothetical protein
MDSFFSFLSVVTDTGRNRRYVLQIATIESRNRILPCIGGADGVITAAEAVTMHE